MATIQGNGELLVGNTHTAKLHLKPGKELEMKLGCKQIRQIPAGASKDK